MWKKDKKRIIMNEGDYGISLPITISGAEIALDEKICFYIIDLNHMVVLIKEYTNIENNTFGLCLTKNESKKLNQGCYRYKIDWCKDDVFKGTIVESEIFEVRKDCVEGIAEEEEVVLNLQIKTAIPTKEQQSITYDEEYDALGEVIVEPIPEEYIKPEGTLEVIENGKYDVTNKAEVNVNVEIPTISDASYLFYSDSKLGEENKLLSICKDLTTMRSMYQNCRNKKEFNLSGLDTSKVTDMSYAFNSCRTATKIDISNFDGSSLTNTALMFGACSKLATVIINNPKVFPLKSSGVFDGTPIESGTGYVYVPDNLVETYRNSTNWSEYASQIKGISELP